MAFGLERTDRGIISEDAYEIAIRVHALPLNDDEMPTDIPDMSDHCATRMHALAQCTCHV
jgi:hypothetical protein